MSYLQKFLLFTLCAGCMTGISCASHEQISEKFDNQIKDISNELVKDKTLNLLEASLVREKKKWLLKGETTLKEVEDRIISYVNELLGEKNYQNNFVLLPHENLGDKKYGIVKVSAANLREYPKHSAQLVDQEIMGHTVKLLKESDGWLMIQTEYSYIGWMTDQSVYRTDSKGIEEWKQSERVIGKSVFTMMYSKPESDSLPVSDITMNCILKLEGTQENWLKVSTPDNRIGYIEKVHIRGVNEAVPSGNDLRRQIVSTAKTMTGIPYHWGGKTSTANDCSGFTHTVFEANGMILLRDASQQAREGVDVEFNTDYENILAGDLLFFGTSDRITHVGISLGGARFIHQSGYVKENSLDPKDKDYSLSSRKKLKRIKRYIMEK